NVLVRTGGEDRAGGQRCRWCTPPGGGPTGPNISPMDIFGWIGAVAGVAGIIVLVLTAWQLRVTGLTRRDARRAQSVSSDAQDLAVAASFANEVAARWKDEIKARSLEPRDLISVRWRGGGELEGQQVDLTGDVSGLTLQVGLMVDKFLALSSQRLMLIGP